MSVRLTALCNELLVSQLSIKRNHINQLALPNLHSHYWR